VRLWIMAMALAAGACAGVDRLERDDGAGAAEGLGSTLNVRQAGDTVRLVLHVTNVTEESVTLEFTSGQRFDFEVGLPGGESVWRWSADKLFVQALGQEVLLPGESRQYDAEWVAPAGGGEYVATGWLTSTNYPVELRTRFEAGGG
jgi:hypothetical protein